MRMMCPLITAMILCAAAQAEEWNDLNVLQINREQPHATMMVYPSQKAALKMDRTTSPWFQSLNGEWMFNWVRSPNDRPADFFKPEFDVSDWKYIAAARPYWPKNRPPIQPSLYNLAEDPGETTNLIAEQPERAQKMAQKLQAMSSSAGIR